MRRSADRLDDFCSTLLIRASCDRVRQLPSYEDLALANSRRPRRWGTSSGSYHSVFSRGILIHIEGQNRLSTVITDSNKRSEQVFLLHDKPIQIAKGKALIRTDGDWSRHA
jgi:hypothetical protein